jgi:hypothetical protein
MKPLTYSLTTMIVFALGCAPAANQSGSSGAMAVQDRIVRILVAEKLLSKKHNSSITSNTKPSQLTVVLRTYCEEANQLDLSGCPADFRVAFRHYIAAVGDMQQAAAQMPEDFAQGVLMGALNSALLGEADGGVGRIQGNMNLAMERMKATYAEVERIGAKYGAAL